MLYFSQEGLFELARELKKLYFPLKVKRIIIPDTPKLYMHTVISEKRRAKKRHKPKWKK